MLQENMPQYLEFVQSHHPLIALMAVGMGCVFLTNGWKLFKILIAADAALLGMLIGATIGERLNRPHMDIILGVGAALIFAALVWPLMKWTVCFLGALSGAAIGYALWESLASAAGNYGLASHAWAGALLGFVTMALLAFIIFRSVAVIVTSLQGAWLVVSGVLCLLLAIDDLHAGLMIRLQESPIIIPALMLVPGILGVIYQESKFLGLMAKKKKAMAKG